MPYKSKLKNITINSFHPLMLTLLLSVPLIVFYFNKVYLIGIGEESIGYRYFYSLRILYEHGNSPFIPQGHLMSSLHCLIQACLSLLGYPLEDLETRMHMFSYVACAMSQIIVFLSCFWALGTMRSIFWKTIFILILVATSFHLRNGGGYHLIVPDYNIWSLSVGLICLGLCARESKFPGYLEKHWYFISLYLGFSFLTKVTYILMPGIILMLMLCNQKWKKNIGNVIKTILLSFLVVMPISLLYYKGNYEAALIHFTPSKYQQFMVNNNQSLFRWSIDTLLNYQLDGTSFIIISPWLFIFGFCLLKMRKISAILFIVTTLNYLVVYQRPYPPTFVEGSIFVIISLTIWLIYLLQEYPFITKKMQQFSDNKTFKVCLLIIGGYIIIDGINNFFLIFMPQYRQSAIVATELHAYLDSIPGKTLYLIPNNHYRPVTIETAIYKGGMNMDDTSNFWPQSHLVNSFASDKSFLIVYPNPNIKVEEYNKLVFVSPSKQAVQYKQLYADHFGINFKHYNCDFSISQSVGGLNWFLPYIYANIEHESVFFPSDAAIPRNIIACRRLDQATIE